MCPMGGVHVAVPDFGAVVEYYNQKHDISAVMGMLYGGQDYEYNYHYCTFDFDSLSAKLHDAGFVDVERYDWREFLPEGYDDYSRSYLPHMDFEHGKLMSLNVKARKV